MLFTIGLYAAALIGLCVSLVQDRGKTVAALRKAWRAFENILPVFLSVILLMSITLAVLGPQMISKLIGEGSGALGVVVAAVVGSVTLIPGLVTFPLAASLLKCGAGFMQVVVFVSTSMMVGVVTMPLEMQYFGRKVAVIRNALALVFSFVIAGVMVRLLR